MNGSAVAALLPVIALIGTGFGLARVGLVRQAAVKDMSNLVFLLLLPSLLFRTMAQVHIGELDYRPIGVYFLSAIIVFVTTMLVYGFNTGCGARIGQHVQQCSHDRRTARGPGLWRAGTGDAVHLDLGARPGIADGRDHGVRVGILP
jgi:hypothetical protein